MKAEEEGTAPQVAKVSLKGSSADNALDHGGRESALGGVSSEAHEELFRDYEDSLVAPTEPEASSEPAEVLGQVPSVPETSQAAPSTSTGALSASSEINSNTEQVSQVVQAKVAAMSIKDKIAAIKARTEAMNSKKEATLAERALSPPAEE